MDLKRLRELQAQALSSEAKNSGCLTELKSVTIKIIADRNIAQT